MSLKRRSSASRQKSNGDLTPPEDDHDDIDVQKLIWKGKDNETRDDKDEEKEKDDSIYIKPRWITIACCVVAGFVNNAGFCVIGW